MRSSLSDLVLVGLCFGMFTCLINLISRPKSSNINGWRGGPTNHSGPQNCSQPITESSSLKSYKVLGPGCLPCSHTAAPRIRDLHFLISSARLLPTAGHLEKRLLTSVDMLTSFFPRKDNKPWQDAKQSECSHPNKYHLTSLQFFLSSATHGRSWRSSHASQEDSDTSIYTDYHNFACQDSDLKYQY